MESLLSINGMAQLISLISLPVIFAAVVLAAVVLTGFAEKIVMWVEDGPLRRNGSR